MTKITIERETVQKLYEAYAKTVTNRPNYAESAFHAGYAAALAAQPEPAQGSVLAIALMDIDSIEHMQGGANGPTIRLRGFINRQLGQVAPQPPIDNAFVAEGCEQFSQPHEPAPVPCCGKYETCSHACTPRGKWLGRREAESEIEKRRVKPTTGD